tara:strand:+ start:80 stop:679 length:600 start_codon:yes stop_codon:yes gene_type:complete
METKYHQRETWLEACMALCIIHLCEKTGTDPAVFSQAKIRISCSWLGGQRTKKAVAQCVKASCATDGHIGINISPARDKPLEVVSDTYHELIHALMFILNIECGHRGEFARIAKLCGFLAPMTSTPMSDALRPELQAIADQLGAYPHGAVDINARKKQTTRMVKVVCEPCNNIARQSRTAYQTHGLVCGTCGDSMLESL